MTEIHRETDIEKKSLPAHVALCGERYRQIGSRLVRIELALYTVLTILLVGGPEVGPLLRSIIKQAFAGVGISP